MIDRIFNESIPNTIINIDGIDFNISRFISQKHIAGFYEIHLDVSTIIIDRDLAKKLIEKYCVK